MSPENTPAVFSMEGVFSGERGYFPRGMISGGGGGKHQPTKFMQQVKKETKTIDFLLKYERHIS